MKVNNNTKKPFSLCNTKLSTKHYTSYYFYLTVMSAGLYFPVAIALFVTWPQSHIGLSILCLVQATDSERNAK